MHECTYVLEGKNRSEYYETAIREREMHTGWKGKFVIPSYVILPLLRKVVSFSFLIKGAFYSCGRWGEEWYTPLSPSLPRAKSLRNGYSALLREKDYRPPPLLYPVFTVKSSVSRPRVVP